MLLDQPVRALDEMSTKAPLASKHSEIGSYSAAAVPAPGARRQPFPATEILLWFAGNHGDSRVNLSEPTLLLLAHLGGEEKPAN